MFKHLLGGLAWPRLRNDHTASHCTQSVPNREEAPTYRQDDLVNVSKFLCECLAAMLGADSDDRSQTSDQPWVAGKM